MDEPLFYGHRSRNPRACALPLTELASDVARRLKLVRSFFPNVIVGDIEPLTLFDESNLSSDLDAWIDAYAQATGEKLGFFHADLDWRLPWIPIVTAAIPALRRRAVPFGVIYNANGGTLSDQDEATSMLQHAVSVEIDKAFSPDQVIFQSWTTTPHRVLPETDMDSFTGILASYVRDRTALTVTRKVGQLVGQLTDSGGKGVPRARVRLQSLDLTGPGNYHTLTSHGLVPEDAKSALLAIRINRECRCARNSDIALRKFQFAEPRASQNPLQGVSLYRNADWQIAGNADVGFSVPPGMDQTSIAIRARSDETAQLNQVTHFPVTAGSEFDFSFELRSSEASNDSGLVAVIFLGTSGREISRAVIPIRTSYRDGPSQITDTQGRFAFKVPPIDPSSQLRIEFKGTKSLFPSAAEIN